MSESHPPPVDETLPLTSATLDGQARRTALNKIGEFAATPTSLIAYRSRGRALIIGPPAYALEQADSLKDRLQCSVLSNAPPTSSIPQGLHLACAELETISGYLGAFKVMVKIDGKSVELAAFLHGPEAGFDLILDLGRPPHLNSELLPPGYYAPGQDREALYAALAEMPDMVGEFERPKYFQYNPDICAHGERGVTGCTRCIDVCPSLALASGGERIEVDAYLCHGVGSCAAACPTGAIQYAYPRADDVIERVRALLGAYIEAGGRHPILLIHPREGARERLARISPRLPECVIPIALEEVTSVGLEVWLAALAFGAQRVVIATLPSIPASVAESLRAQAAVLSRVLDGLKIEGLSMRCVDVDDDKMLQALQPATPQQATQPAKFAVFKEKRTMLQMSLDHLHGQAPAADDFVTLSAGAAFGRILVDTQACTLCMACTSVCPAAALSAGSEHPQLGFSEWNCVQCGLCERACPENAIRLEARMALLPEARRGRRVLHEEQPFCCVVCGTPFAARGVIEKMTERLKSHHMFQGDALKRLQMCEDCRVKDIFTADGAGT